MKKIISFLFILLLLTGCMSYSSDIYESKMNDFIDNLEYRTLYQNNFSKYFNYYLPSDMSEEEADFEYVVFHYLDSNIVMNLNITSIIEKDNENYNFKDASLFDDNFISYMKEGEYIDLNKETHQFVFKAFYLDYCMLLQLCSDVINIYAYTSFEEAYVTSTHMFTLAQGLSIDTKTIYTSFSSSKHLDTQTETIDIFSYIVPENGNLDDLLK